MAKNTELCAILHRALDEKWGYVWGLNGELYTKELAEKYAKARRSPPDGRDPVNYWIKDCAKWIGRMAADCSGVLVYAMRQLGVFSATQDRSSGYFKNTFTKGGAIATIPNIPGLGVWRTGHIGLYIGNGEVIEARSTSEGVVKTKLKDRNFTHWGMFPGIDYDTEGDNLSPLARVASCTGDGVNIRNGKNSGTESLGKVSKGHPLVVGEEIDNWFPVATVVNNNKPVAGYMYKDYVSK